MSSPEVDRFLEMLDGVKADGSGWSARCPCRGDDHNPSLHVGQGHDGRVLVTCHRGGDACDVGQICTAMGLTMNDLFPPDTDRDREFAERRDRDRPVRPAQKPTAPPVTVRPQASLTLTDIYPYHDADGTVLFQKVRYVDDETGKKTFRQRRQNPNGGWIYNLDDIPKVLYRLPEVNTVRSNGGFVWVVEGEKDADTLRGMGEIATTMPGGAGKWLNLHTDTLAGMNVMVVADTDEVGIRHANHVVNVLRAAGCKVTAMQPPAPHKDITDFIDNGGDLTDLVDMTEAPATTTVAELPDQALDDLVEHPGFITVDEPSPFTTALTAITRLVDNDRLSDSQRFARAQALLDSLRSDEVLDTGRLVDWGTFFEEADDDYDWVIPGLLERQDRVIVVAAEGVGKSVLSRQVAIAASMGLHPFTRQPIPKISTLTIDLENPDRIIRRVTKNTYRVARGMVRNPDPFQAHLLIKPSGLNLLKPADRAFVEETIERTKPDLICMGPLYKSFIDPGGRTSEAVVGEVVRFLDYIRTEYNCALWLEHHAPLGNALAGRDLRPFGSAVWSRWPEFGITIALDPTAQEKYTYDVGSFRGYRDKRHWPTKMKRGSVDDLPFHILEYITDGTT